VRHTLRSFPIAIGREVNQQATWPRCCRTISLRIQRWRETVELTLGHIIDGCVPPRLSSISFVKKPGRVDLGEKTYTLDHLLHTTLLRILESQIWLILPDTQRTRKHLKCPLPHPHHKRPIIQPSLSFVTRRLT
jgi:hypothetical protein